MLTSIVLKEPLLILTLDSVMDDYEEIEMIMEMIGPSRAELHVHRQSVLRALRILSNGHLIRPYKPSPPTNDLAPTEITGDDLCDGSYYYLVTAAGRALLVSEDGRIAWHKANLIGTSE